MTDQYAVSNKLPSRQVSILAQRKKRIHHDEALHKLKSKGIRRALHKKSIGFHKAEYFVNKFLLAERDENRVRRAIATTGLSKKVPSNQKLILVFRHRAKIVASKVVQNALTGLGVKLINRAALVKVTKKSKALLAIAEPYIAYGYPTINTIRDLVFKHGFMTIDRKRVPMTSNIDIEKMLGEYGIICVEDIVHELFTVGKHFEEVRRLIGSFKFIGPRDGYQKKGGVAFDAGGEYGNRKDGINELIARCM